MYSGDNEVFRVPNQMTCITASTPEISNLQFAKYSVYSRP